MLKGKYTVDKKDGIKSMLIGNPLDSYTRPVSNCTAASCHPDQKTDAKCPPHILSRDSSTLMSVSTAHVIALHPTPLFPPTVTTVYSDVTWITVQRLFSALCLERVYLLSTLDVSEVVLLQTLRDWFPLKDMGFCNFSTLICLHVLSMYSSWNREEWKTLNISN